MALIGSTGIGKHSDIDKFVESEKLLGLIKEAWPEAMNDHPNLEDKVEVKIAELKRIEAM